MVILCMCANYLNGRRQVQVIYWFPKKRWMKPNKPLLNIMIKLVIIGAGGVGKTNIIRRCVHDEFLQDHKSTIADVYEKHFSSKRKKTSMIFHIYDTAGSDQFPAMNRLVISNGQLFVVVYAVDDRESFEEAKKICTKIYDIKGTVKSIMMVGNKCDIPSSKQIVTTTEAVSAARHMNCKFMESSAKLGINVERIFRESLTFNFDQPKRNDNYTSKNENITNLQRASERLAGKNAIRVLRTFVGNELRRKESSILKHKKHKKTQKNQ